MNALENAFYVPKQINETYIQTLQSWIIQYQIICDEENPDPAKRAQRMNSVNPKYVLRNYLAQETSDKATEGSLSTLCPLQNMLRNPHKEHNQNMVNTP